MTARDRQPPARTPQAEADRQRRLEREAAALRDNLRRRKQARAQGPVNDAADSSADPVSKRPE